MKFEQLLEHLNTAAEYEQKKKTLESSLVNLKPREKVLSLGRLEMLSRLDKFEAPYLEERLLKEGTFNTPHAYNEAFTEFKKYASLHVLFKEPMAMISEQVDEVWHTLILFTKKYAAFCNDYLGGFMHHVPATSDAPINTASKDNFVRRYNEVFGDLHPIWNKNAPCTECCTDSCSSESGGD